MNVFTNTPVDAWLNIAGFCMIIVLLWSHVCRKKIFLKYCIDLVLQGHILCSLMDMQLFNLLLFSGIVQ